MLLVQSALASCSVAVGLLFYYLLAFSAAVNSSNKCISSFIINKYPGEAKHKTRSIQKCLN